MATIKDLVDEIQTIANAHQPLKGFAFEDTDYLNKDRGSNYPFLLMDRNVRLNSYESKTGQRLYTCNFIWYDLYHRQIEADSDSQDLEFTLETLSTQFIQEFQNRVQLQSPVKFAINNISTGQYGFYKLVDRLYSLQIQIQFRVIGSCPTGIFNY